MHISLFSYPEDHSVNITARSEVLLPKLKLDLTHSSLLARLLDISRRHVRPAKVHSHLTLTASIQPRQIILIKNTLSHPHQQPIEIRPTKIRPRRQLRQRILISPHGIENNILRRIGVNPLRKIRVNPQKLLLRSRARHAQTLRFKRRQQSLEPFERRRVFADPDELDSAQTPWRVRRQAHVPDILKNRCPGRDADAGADEDGDFVLEDVFCRGAVRAVDAEFGHHLAILQGHFVHSHGVEFVVEVLLFRASAKGGGEGAGEVAYLADVDAYVGVEGAGGDGEGVPFVLGDGGYVDEEPLACLVVHAGFAELDFYGVWEVELGGDACVCGWGGLTVRMSYDFDDLSLST
jgi:hypothetical protein